MQIPSIDTDSAASQFADVHTLAVMELLWAVVYGLERTSDTSHVRSSHSMKQHETYGCVVEALLMRQRLRITPFHKVVARRERTSDVEHVLPLRQGSVP